MDDEDRERFQCVQGAGADAGNDHTERTAKPRNTYSRQQTEGKDPCFAQFECYRDKRGEVYFSMLEGDPQRGPGSV